MTQLTRRQMLLSGSGLFAAYLRGQEPGPFGTAIMAVNADTQAAQWLLHHKDDRMAPLVAQVALRPMAFWFKNTSNVREAVGNIVVPYAKGNSLPVLVAYSIPKRDCGQYSGGGLSPQGYRNWIKDFAAGIGDHMAAVILEPDALSNMDCLSGKDKATRLELLNFAVDTLSALPHCVLYLDGGHPRWHDAADSARRLAEAGVAKARGFFLNVSNFQDTGLCIGYGQEIVKDLAKHHQAPDKHFVIDTSRNGKGPPPMEGKDWWCNPAGVALGPAPTLQTRVANCDAFWWVKTPGESDGDCNGNVTAGEFSPKLAVELVRNMKKA